MYYNGQIIKDNDNNILKSWKVIILGDSTVGKTSIILRFVGKFSKNRKNTIGVDYFTRIIDDPFGMIQLYDTAGQESFRSLIPMYIRNCDIAIIVCDVTKEKSFDSIIHWIEEIKNKHEEKDYYNHSSFIRTIIVANKIDLISSPNQEKINETKMKISNIATLFQCKWILTSALCDINITELFALVKGEIKAKVIEEENLINQNINQIKKNITSTHLIHHCSYPKYLNPKNYCCS